MTAKTDAAPQARLEKPRLALVIATAFGVGYIPKAPGTFGSLVGVATAFLSAVFFLRPASLGGLLSLHPNYDAVLMDKHFLVPGSDVHDAILALPIFCALALLALLGAIGVWSASRAAAYAGGKDPQFVVVDEVAGQHLALLLPLIPIALPNLNAHMDFSTFAIFLRAEPGELEIPAARFYTFSRIRHLEAVAGAPTGKTPRRLGNHGG